MIRRSFTATVARNEAWTGKTATEPYECGWASEAIFFVRALATAGDLRGATARIEISPDGIRWCEEGTAFGMPLQAEETTFGKVSHFGGYLRIVAEIPPGASVTVVVALALKE